MYNNMVINYGGHYTQIIQRLFEFRILQLISTEYICYYDGNNSKKLICKLSTLRYSLIPNQTKFGVSSASMYATNKTRRVLIPTRIAVYFILLITFFINTHFIKLYSLRAFKNDRQKHRPSSTIIIIITITVSYLSKARIVDVYKGNAEKYLYTSPWRRRRRWHANFCRLPCGESVKLG